MATTEFTVTGMTCNNCEAHVREEVEAIATVTHVEVDRRTGKLAVTTDGAPAPRDAVLKAVDEAGYTAIPA